MIYFDLLNLRFICSLSNLQLNSNNNTSVCIDYWYFRRYSSEVDISVIFHVPENIVSP